jgi:hypothetical protein
MYEAKPNGEAVAAMIASGIGCLALGLFTTLAEAIAPFKTFMNFNNPVGPLSGKTTYAVVVWLIAWAVLHFVWKDKDTNFAKAFTWTLVLIGLGFLGTFPIFFELFTGLVK